MKAIRIESRRARNVRAALMVAAALGAATAASLQPAVAGAAPTLGPTARTQQCVISEHVGSSTQRCFDTAAEAISFASGGQIKLAKGATTHDGIVALRAHDTTVRHTSSQERGLSTGGNGTRRRSFLTSNIIGIEYDGSRWSGSAKYFSVSGDCYGGSTFGYPKLSIYGWNDRINSAETFVGCVGFHYDDTNYSDTVTTVFGSKSDFGGQNNKTSSIKFT